MATTKKTTQKSNDFEDFDGAGEMDYYKGELGGGYGSGGGGYGYDNDNDKTPTTDQKINTTNNFIGLLEKINDLRLKWGVGGIIKNAFIVFIVVAMGYIVFNFKTVAEGVVSTVNEIVESNHEKKIKLRQDNTPNINLALDQIGIETGAIRVFILEGHNGTKSISGLPFTFLTMSYERTKDGYEYVSDEYRSFQYTKFRFISDFLYNESFWSGSTEEMAEIDKKLALRCESNGTKHVVMYQLYGLNSTIGFLGLSFANTEDVGDIHLSKYTQEISKLLDTEKK